LFAKPRFKLEELLARRERKPYVEVPTALTQEMADECAAAFEDDLTEVRKFLPKAADCIPRKAAPVAPVKQPFPLGGGPLSVFSVEQVSKVMPPDCLVQRETWWHTRWRAVFPKAGSPNTASRNFGGLCTELAAVKKLTVAAWAISVREGGQPCPWVISDSDM
jgi:hypothetical protein